MAKKIEKNVLDFIDKCSINIGSMEAESADIDMWNNCYDSKIESPIEMLLYCALYSVMRLNFLRSLTILPQRKIGKYRVDFLVSYTRKEKLDKQVVVECDSQQFHDRTERERRYEKIRDRYLVSENYKIFHFTGSEIYNKPLDVSREIIAYLTEIPIEDLLGESYYEVV